MTTSTSEKTGPAIAMLAYCGAVLLWLSQPPIAVAPLAWIALVPWGLLIARAKPLGRRGWWIVWSAGAVYWLVTMQGVRLANAALYPGWFVLAAYLGVYPMLAVGLGRTMHHGWRCPVWLALPTVWSGLELVRSYAFTGFSAALLGHSQADVPYVIQIADIGGTYFVSFVIAMVSGIFASLIHEILQKRRSAQQANIDKSTTSAADSPRSLSGNTIIGFAVTLVIVCATLGYGYWRVAQANELAKAEPLLKAIMLQRNEPLEFTLNPSKEADVFTRYFQLMMQAAADNPDADLVIWPESMFTGGLPYRAMGANPQVPSDVLDPDSGQPLTISEFTNLISVQADIFRERAAEMRRMMASSSAAGKAPEMLVGTSVYEYDDVPHAYGAAVHIDGDSKIAAWYGKMHLVMFGEYIPFGTYFPWLYEIGPLRQGATPGKGPVSMHVAGVSVAPSICFETMVEQVTGNGLRRLNSQSQTADIIANLTNDAWFHGTAILTHHRRCSQLVAVCNRRPLLMTANQGPTTWIDGSGRRIESLPYETDGILIAQPTPDRRNSLYRQFGDAASWPLVMICGALAFDHLRKKRNDRSQRKLNKIRETKEESA